MACSFQQTLEFNECQVLLKWESSRCNQVRKNGLSTPEKESRSERKQACKPQYIPHASKKTLTNLYKMWKNVFWKRFEFSKIFTLRWAAQKFANFYSEDFLRFLEHPKFTGELRCQEKQVYLKKLEVPTNLGKNQCFSQTIDCSFFRRILIISDNERKQSLTMSRKRWYLSGVQRQ